MVIEAGEGIWCSGNVGLGYGFGIVLFYIFG